jgi:hypothetical protein
MLCMSNDWSHSFHFRRCLSVICVYTCNRSDNTPKPISWMKLQSRKLQVDVSKPVCCSRYSTFLEIKASGSQTMVGEHHGFFSGKR